MDYSIDEQFDMLPIYINYKILMGALNAEIDIVNRKQDKKYAPLARHLLVGFEQFATEGVSTEKGTETRYDRFKRLNLL